MSGNARFHDKLHRANHHTLSTSGILDSAYDPIASPSHPFRGDFILSGSLSALNNVGATNISARSDLNVSGYTNTKSQTIEGNLKLTNVNFGGASIYANISTPRIEPFTLSLNYQNGVYISDNLYVNKDLRVRDLTALGTIWGSMPSAEGFAPTTSDISYAYSNLSKNSAGWVEATNWVASNSSDMVVDNLLVTGNLTALGTSTIVDLYSNTSDALSVVNVGLGVPAIYAEVKLGSLPVLELKHTGSGPILSSFSGGKTFVINNSGWIGIGTEPSFPLHISSGPNINGHCRVLLEADTDNGINEDVHAGIFFKQDGGSRLHYIGTWGATDHDTFQLRASDDISFSNWLATPGVPLTDVTPAIERFRIRTDGISILSGDLRVTGNIYANVLSANLPPAGGLTPTTQDISNAYTTVYTKSATWDAAAAAGGADLTVRGLTGNWQSTYTTVNTNSSNWNYQGLDLKALSSNWESTYTTVYTNSALWDAAASSAGADLTVRGLTGNWDSTYTTVNTKSASWDSTYTTVYTNSSNWNYQGLDIKPLTSNWESTYTTVNTKSASWDAASSSAGADLTVRGLTGNWDSTYTTVNTNSSNWNYQGLDLKALSSNWQSTYTTVNTKSASWDAASSSAGADLTVRALTANWQSTYTTVNTKSASWDSTYTTVNTKSASWDSTYTTVNTKSASWDSTYTTVNTKSASWDVSNYIKLKSYTETSVVSAISSNNIAIINLAEGTVFPISLNRNITQFELRNIPSGVNSFLVTLTQDAVGGRTIAWSFGVGKTIKWSGGAPTMTATANATDIISFMSIDGLTWYGSTAGQNFV
jgi:hypothetical protein